MSDENNNVNDEMKKIMENVLYELRLLNAKADRQEKINGQILRAMDDLMIEVRQVKRHMYGLEVDLDQTINRVKKIEDIQQ